MYSVQKQITLKQHIDHVISKILMANPSQEAHETVEFFDHIAIKHKCVNLYDCPDCSVGFLLETGLKTFSQTTVPILKDSYAFLYKLI